MDLQRLDAPKREGWASELVKSGRDRRYGLAVPGPVLGNAEENEESKDKR
jgi:hypothetical protein